MRALTITREKNYCTKLYVNTCNGILLIASEYSEDPGQYRLWNPAVADMVEVVTLPNPAARMEYVALGLGYGPRTETCKILLLLVDGRYPHTACKNHLVIYQLGDAKKQPTVLEGQYGKINQQSVYIDGTVYLIDSHNSAVLAFDVDNEIITSIHFPNHPTVHWNILSQPVELSGQLCLALNDDKNRSLWLLSKGHQWERLCQVNEPADNIHDTIQGIWRCGDVIVLYSEGLSGISSNTLFLYNTTTGKTFRAIVPGDMAPEWDEYAICWGYNPTLVSPRSINGKTECQPSDILQALKPMIEHYKKQGHEESLHIVCFMNFLFRVMGKLPQDLKDLIGVPLTKYTVEPLVFVEHEL